MFFEAGKRGVLTPRFTTQFTTTSPQKTTSRTPFFQKTPAKTGLCHPKKNYGRYFAGIGFVGVSESQKILTTQ
jgi:hypothetical protein